MKRILVALFLSCLMISTAFADSATFHIADRFEEDTEGFTGFFDVNSVGDETPWQFFGYNPDLASYITAYWRWGIDIPRGSTITQAYLDMYSTNYYTDVFDAAFWALAPDGKWDGKLAFSPANYPTGGSLRHIPRMGSAVSWPAIPPWEKSVWYKSPDISRLVQTRIDLDDYNPRIDGIEYFGLALYHVAGTGFRGTVQETVDDGYSVVLYVEWVPPWCGGPDAVEICGDGIDNNCDGQVDEFCNQCPTADAGEDPAAYVGDLVQLDGSGSTDPDGDVLLYAWSLVDKPTGSAAVLSDPTALTPSMQIDVPGEYVVELVVNDGQCESAPDIVVVSTLNTCPSADAGVDMAAYVGDLLTLAGGGDDADGDTLAYIWSLIEKPKDSTAELLPSDSVTPTIAIDVPGEYVVALVVNDGLCESAPDSLTISTHNVRPVANAGPDAKTLTSLEVVLDGEASYDPDGDALAYSWSVLSTPLAAVSLMQSESDAQITDSSDVSPGFHANAPGEYVVQLIVSDGDLESEPDTCVISVTDPNCPEGKSYWKHHPDDWPVDYLEIAGELYDADELLDLLTMPSRGDASIKLAEELIATKLNLANGCDPIAVADAVWEAEAMLAEFSGRLPLDVESWSRSGQAMKELARELESYNSAELTPDCTGGEDDSGDRYEAADDDYASDKDHSQGRDRDHHDCHKNRDKDRDHKEKHHHSH